MRADCEIAAITLFASFHCVGDLAGEVRLNFGRPESPHTACEGALESFGVGFAWPEVGSPQPEVFQKTHAPMTVF